MTSVTTAPRPGAAGPPEAARWVRSTASGESGWLVDVWCRLLAEP